jgi:hypothetical protein
MLETTRIRREGYAVRPPFGEFVERFVVLLRILAVSSGVNSCFFFLQQVPNSGFFVFRARRGFIRQLSTHS